MNYTIEYLSTSTESDSEKHFFAIISEYLALKSFIPSASLEFTEILSQKQSENSFLFEYCKEKNLTQFYRQFQDRKLSKSLTESLNKYIVGLIKDPQSNPVALFRVLMVMPFLSNEQNSIDSLLTELLSSLTQNLTSESNDFDLLLLAINIWSALSSNPQRNINDSLFEKVINVLISVENRLNERSNAILNLLRSIDFLISFKYREKVEFASRERLFEFLKNQLVSPYHHIRLISLNVLQKFVVKSADNQEDNVIDVCLKAEKIESTLEDYRNKLYFMGLLEYDLVGKLYPNENYHDVPLKYFIGVLFENFKLVWDPVIKLIQSYALNMQANAFWNVFCEYFERLTDIIGK